MKTLYVLIDRECYDVIQGVFEKKEDAEKYASLLRTEDKRYTHIEQVGVNIGHDGYYPYRVYVSVKKDTPHDIFAVFPCIGNFDYRLSCAIKYDKDDDRYGVKDYIYFCLAANGEKAREKAIREFKAHYDKFNSLFPDLHDRCVECDGGFMETPYYDVITAQRILLDGQKLIF